MATGHLLHYLDRYIAPNPSRQVKALFRSSAILDFATSAIMVFEPVYLVSLGYGIRAILLFFAAVYAAYFILLPLGGRICRNHGFAHVILLSSPFLILYYLSLFATAYHPTFLFVAGAALAIQKTLYWPGYHANFATYAGIREEGREIADRAALAQVATVLGPLIGGLIVAKVGFWALFVFVAGLILASGVPLLSASEKFVPKPFSYGTALDMVFRKENRKSLFGYMGYGEELIALILWPIFIAATLKSTVALGAVVSAAMFVSIIVTLYVGRAVDGGNRAGMMRSGMALTAASWLLRPFFSGPLGIFSFDGFYRIAKNIVGIPLVAIVYDGGKTSSVVESIVFFEMALALGKFSAAALGIVLVTFVKGYWSAIFLLAAAFSVLYVLIGDRRLIKRP